MSKNSTITIYCIYNAEGSIIGELKYLLLKYFYGFKCSMCEITHTNFSEKKEWKKKNIESAKMQKQQQGLKGKLKKILKINKSGKKDAQYKKPFN